LAFFETQIFQGKSWATCITEITQDKRVNAP
ncbi:hypothetical protein Y032_0070g404, partial [Ancylostoma ceylanicum]